MPEPSITQKLKDLGFPSRSEWHLEDPIDLAMLRPGDSRRITVQYSNTEDKIELESGYPQLVDRPCPTCDHNGIRNIFLQKGNITLVKCPDCGLVFQSPVLDSSAIKERYRAPDYQQVLSSLVVESHSYRVSRFGMERIGILERHHDPRVPRRVLDIGSSTGFFLEAAQNSGWDAVGVELAPESRDFSKSRGHQVEAKPLEEIDFRQQFGAVTLFDTLEHLENPKETVERARDLLVHGGNLFVYVPNIDSVSFSLQGEGANFIMRNHLQYYSPETLFDLLIRSGFEPIHVETRGLDVADWLTSLELEGITLPPQVWEGVGSLQEACNRSGFGKNLRMLARRN